MTKKENHSLVSILLLCTICSLIVFMAIGIAIWAATCRMIQESYIAQEEYFHVQFIAFVPFLSWNIILFLYALLMRKIISSLSKGLCFIHYLYDAFSMNGILLFAFSLLLSAISLLIGVEVNAFSTYAFSTFTFIRIFDFYYLWYIYFFLTVVLFCIPLFIMVYKRDAKVPNKTERTEVKRLLKRYCKECGTELPSDALYCKKCGAEVSMLIGN